MNPSEEVKNIPVENMPEGTSEKKEASTLPEKRELSGSDVSQPSPQDDKDASTVQEALKADQSAGTNPQSSQKTGQTLNAVKKDSKSYIIAAEKIIEENKGNPYKEDEDHNDLQNQYLQERFGKDIKKKND